MKNKAAKKAIASYYILTLLLTLPPLIPFWLIKEVLWLIVYCICCVIYIRIASTFAVQATVMSSLLEELDAEKYAAIINAKPFWVHYGYELNLHMAVGDYQAAYNIISSLLLPNKNVQNRIYGQLLFCRVCFERGDYEGLRKPLEELDNYFRYNTKIRISKSDKAAYAFYRAFVDSDYEAACALREGSIAQCSKKNTAYLRVLRQYQLAVVKRMKGDVDEAVALFEEIKEKAPKLIFSTLAQQQLDYISGTLDETVPEQLEVTENDLLKSSRKSMVIARIAACVGCCCFVLGVILLTLPDFPMQENMDPDYVAQIEDTIRDEYEDCRILGYFNIYSDYADETYMMTIDSLFLVEADGRLDLHTFYQLNGENQSNLNVTDIQVDTRYAYEVFFVPRTVVFVLTEKERNVPEDALYYYEIDGYYFCVLGISDD